MRFRVVGHASLHLEVGETSVLIDPWLFGSCYWRSWWHYPPTMEPDEALLSPDFVYLTHHHFDHFHYPSMRRIDRDTNVLIARFGVDVMAGELHELGFRNVTELDHGEPTEIAPGVRVASYQYGFDDTVFVVQTGEHTLVDLNDCKIRGRALDQVVEQFGRPTFMFKTHSWAQSYPILYEADDPADLGLLTRQTYIEEFLAAARQLRPRYAVPFANMVAFLHPESRAVNPHLIPPGEVAEAFAAAPVEGTDLVILSPGDSWDSGAGFDRSTDVDWYGDRERRIARMVEEVQPTLDRFAAEEAERHLDFTVFRDYLERFLRDLPPGVGRTLLARPVVFELPDDELPYWVIDGRRKRVWRQAEPPPDRADIIRVAEAVLADAIENRILHFVHGAMRIRVHLRPGGVHADLAFWGLMMIWEIGYLPVTRVMNRRAVEVIWRRRRELVDAASAMRGRGSPLERLSTGFAAEETRAA